MHQGCTGPDFWPPPEGRNQYEAEATLQQQHREAIWAAGDRVQELRAVQGRDRAAGTISSLSDGHSPEALQEGRAGDPA